MKRVSNLFEKIIDYNNLRTAYLKSLKGKRNRPCAILFSKKTDENLLAIKNKLKNPDKNITRYNQFKIYDPKERVISVVPFEDRVLHHAIINILEPVFERQFIFHTYACRKNKGLHKAVRYAFESCRKSKYFIKMDVKKFFDSIDKTVLKSLLRKILKDKKCLCLLDSIIDSYSQPGLPIGNLTSQFFANYYLSSLDHFVLENLNPKGYVRYMDDMLIFEDDINRLKVINHQVEVFLKNKLNLDLKFSHYGKCSSGIPFLGRLIFDKKICFLRKTMDRKKRKLKKLKKLVAEEKMDELLACEKAFCIVNERIV